MGAWLLGLPWQVYGVMLAADEAYYEAQSAELLRRFVVEYGEELGLDQVGGLGVRVGGGNGRWVRGRVDGFGSGWVGGRA